MPAWKPKRSSTPEGDKLTPEEDFVFSRVDGSLSTEDIVALTGMERGRVEQILGKLKGAGMLESGDEAQVVLSSRRGEAIPEEGYSNPWLGEVLPAMGSDLDVNEPSIPTVEAPRVLSVAAAQQAAEPMMLGPEHEVHSDPSVPGELPTTPRLDELYSLGPSPDDTGQKPTVRSSEELLAAFGVQPKVPEFHPEDAGRGYDAHAEEAEPMFLGPEHEVADEEPPLLGPEHEVHEEEGASEGDKRQSTRPPGIEDAERNYRKIYETEYRPLEADARIEKARHAVGPHLFALCFDPDPKVIGAIFQNPTAGLDQARMIGRYHKTPQGLEFIVKRAEFVRDPQVARVLVRNDMMNDSLMRRVLGTRRMADVYKVTIDRDVPERNRVYSRGILRTKWTQSQAEDRADLVISTEARCLILLVGQTFDARTTSILCGRQYNSVLFIQNLARFPACPPPLLSHLIKQPFVRRNPQLKKLLLQHPNMPSDMKRSF